MISDLRNLDGESSDKDWIQRARGLKFLLEEAAEEAEKSGTISDDILDALHGARLFRTVTPRSVGGAELKPETHAQIVAAVAEGDASVAWCIAQTACASMASAYLEPSVAQTIFGDPRAVFTFGFASNEPPCVAIPVPGGWRTHGTMGFREWQPSRDMARWALPAVRQNGEAIEASRRPLCRTHDGLSASGRDFRSRELGRDGSARHGK